MEDWNLASALRYPWLVSTNREHHALKRREVTLPPMDPGDVVEPDEMVRSYVSALWAKDWNSPEDSLWDSTPT